MSPFVIYLCGQPAEHTALIHKVLKVYRVNVLRSGAAVAMDCPAFEVVVVINHVGILLMLKPSRCILLHTPAK